MSKASPKVLSEAFSALTFKPDRTPESDDMDSAFCKLAPYRDGAVFLAHWAGRSEWEVHHSGDEMVMVIEGATEMSLLIDNEEIIHTLSAGELIVVPQSVWHRFNTPREVKLLTITPQPAEHSIDWPL